MSQFIATALAEKRSALMTHEYLEERGRRGDRRQFDRALARVCDVEPAPRARARNDQTNRDSAWRI